ncbi:MAG: NADH-quinone oxidoreductase subunit NuoN [Actinomycetaceae bacterium]|nr:NADH-quinone oxidoreductase subunit NuoN [Actinomycetaceae bacterium]
MFDTVNPIHFEWAAILPLLIVLGAGVVGTIFEAFLPRSARRSAQIGLSLLALAAGLVTVVWRWTQHIKDVEALGLAAPGEGSMLLPLPLSFSESAAFLEGRIQFAFVEDGISLSAHIIILVVAILAFLVIADRSETREGAFVAAAATRPGSREERESIEAKREQTEIFPLSLFAVGGMMAFVSASDLLTLFIALEVLSLPLYVLSATARRRRLLSQESALKYFLLGAFSSAIFLMGAAFIYGATGTLSYWEIQLIQVGLMPGQYTELFMVVGAVMVVIGMLFKVGAAPFHSWTPDVYQGAPTPITGFMAAGTKAAAFVALARLAVYVTNGVQVSLNTFMWIVIILTIVVGSVAGVLQKDIKRMLAYSSIAHAGFILIAINAFTLDNVTNWSQVLSGLMFYLLAYGVATVGAFGIITLVHDRDSEGNILGEATKLENWAGLGKRSPLLATAMLVFLLSFAGIPLTGGFIGKFEVFRSGIASGQTVLVVVGVLASAVTAFFYFRLVQLMFFTEPETDRIEVLHSEGLTIVTVVLALAATIALGVVPGPVLDFFIGMF